MRWFINKNKSRYWSHVRDTMWKQFHKILKHFENRDYFRLMPHGADSQIHEYLLDKYKFRS